MRPRLFLSSHRLIHSLLPHILSAGSGNTTGSSNSNSSSGFYYYCCCSSCSVRAYTTTTPPSDPSCDSTEVLQVELLLPDEDQADDDHHYNYNSNDANGDERDPARSHKDEAAETITAVDSFARAKVANFITHAVSSSSPSSSSSSSVEVRAVQTAGGEEALFHARLRLPLPAAYGERHGEGLAPDAKTAELVAAMHAVRVLDALGLPLFRLPERQRRHAAAAREAGRWAPMPGDAPRPPDTPSPPRLLLLSPQQQQKGGGGGIGRDGPLGQWGKPMGNTNFTNVTAAAFTPMRLTLASPFFLDYGSVYRIKQFLASYNCNIQHYCRVIPLHKYDSKTPGGAALPVKDEDKMFLVQLRLPIDNRFGERIALGKAPLKKDAIALACMHAELIIDALGLALYPSCKEKQKVHAEECRKVNRWCSDPDEYEYHYDKVSPPPLQLIKDTSTPTATEADPTGSVESILLTHAKAIDSFTNVTEVQSLVPSVRREFLNYIAQYRRGTSEVASPFFVEVLGVKDHYVYRATITVPVPVVGKSEVFNESTDCHSTTNSSSIVHPSFVAIGIGTSEMEAETAASMHAVRVLELLNRPLVPDEKITVKGTQLNLTSDTVIPPPYRYVVCHIGRIMVPGLSPTRSIGASSEMSRRRHSDNNNNNNSGFRDNQESRLRRARAEIAKTDWSLDADADGYIIVNPNVNVQEGRNYVHTLPSVRQADRFAIVRLRDYLERHGKRLEVAVITTKVETDEGLKRWIKKVTLPLPEVFGHIIAHGEAYTEEEALVMCAVHAELLLDEIGAPLYDLDALQEKHSDAAAMLGRWAPSKAGKVRRDVRLPPPVRKEHEKSCLWGRLSMQTMRKRNVSTTEGSETGIVTGIRSHEKDVTVKHEGGIPTTRPKSTSSLLSTTAATVGGRTTGKNESLLSSLTERKIESGKKILTTTTTTTTERLTESNPTPAMGGKVTDDVLCDLDSLDSVHPNDFFRHAPRLLDTYCKRKGVDINRSMRQYSVKMSSYGFVHRAVLELPVPSQFGRRHAVGCALSKKEAFGLCCMHAVTVLGALGIPIYTGAKQAEYAAISRSKGREAPRPGDPLQPGDTKSPPGLKSLPDVYMEKPRPPNPPSLAECRKPFIWTSYVTASRNYIEKARGQVIFDALFSQKKAPRSGIDVEDKALDVVESMPLLTNVRSKLPQKCAAARLPSPPPPPHSFRFEPYGLPPERRYLVEQPILGTPFIARGMGEEGQEAVTRAAMHYEYIVGIIGNAQHSQGDTRQILQQRCGDLFDAELRDFSLRGKLSIMALYTTLRAPFAPLRLTLKERSGNAGTPSVFISLVEMEDESGLRMAGKGEDCTNIEGARNRAIAELFKQLQRKSAFQSVAQMVRSHPTICAEGASCLVAEGKIISTLRSILEKQKKQLLLLHYPSMDTIGWGNRVSQELCGGESHLESLELRLLFDVVKNALGSTMKPLPLTIPAASRHLLTRMGLIFTNESEKEFHNGTEVKTIGVAVALFATCLPPLFLQEERLDTSTIRSALPMQLAKLLFSGCLMNCQNLCIRVVALVLYLQCVDVNHYNGEKSGDVLELLKHELPDGAKKIATIIASRLQKLTCNLKRKYNDKDKDALLLNSLIASMESSNPSVNKDVWGSLPEGLTVREEARLRFSISFATFPQVFIQRKAATDNILRMITLESKDRQQTVRVGVPSSLVESTGSSSSSSSSSSDTVSFCCYSSFPCFSAFDKINKHRTSTLNNSSTVSEELSILGTFISPSGVLLSSIFCDESHMMSITDDVSNMALVNSFIPVVLRTSDSLNAVVELSQVLKMHWSLLKSLPEDVQNVMDDLLVSKHSLKNVVQAALLE
ncbi:uncharacterized protein TM35_000092770 [Trypanosoma theileri]|uniref:REH2 DRSM domain-containing protein n=1 Tax=Trypanosoma theileri TaxID=67003 RepID=A0A1X0NZV6_9TRYP|nr:uncharacterized protein TM35_000092770 [Trypanosoma theileri]ORC90227.1 hypothetical protein TM35_000092770 [Trypanosoma theileri]